MGSEASRLLADWSCEQALVWIVTRDLAAVLQPNTWPKLKAEQPSGAGDAEASLLQQLRVMSIISSARSDELDLSSPGWRQRNVAVEWSRWPNCYAHPAERFNPSQIIDMYPSDCPPKPSSDAGRVSAVQIAEWMACQHSVRSRSLACLQDHLENLLLAYSRGLGDVVIRAWPEAVPVGEPGTLSPQTMAAFLAGDVSIAIGPGFPGSGKLDGCSLIGDSGALWSGLHFLEYDIMPALMAYDFSCPFDKFASTRAAQYLFPKRATQRLETVDQIDQGRAQNFIRKRGAPRIDDSRWLQIMGEHQRKGMTENASALEVVRRHDKEIVGASVEAKQDRLRRKWREMR